MLIAATIRPSFHHEINLKLLTYGTSTAPTQSSGVKTAEALADGPLVRFHPETRLLSHCRQDFTLTESQASDHDSVVIFFKFKK